MIVASKGGIMLLMRSLAQELAPHFIRVNGIAPGDIQQQRLEHARGLCGSHDFGGVQADRRAGRYRSGSGVARV
jgi:NAD(P)-dependent dehydrogenase (short-subunit alcohol dehydrogenase family)